ncbi:CDP-alcohol phosphatidyltransferase family protein [Pinisolibacter aquiterrae]|uniref:CDP-alcohol phosphatidyltransferase family protein n=1 Tax=Pinisolibacter aquiterrae TaxID=2815579 RepID=UPI001C3E2475|nr:phosphatidylcholine/phosphatidylserine synthase [Pinisolibacter aquiterrae]MBV5263049.1 phosphatidylcholine/phosphatidylserine synthase [Pinisolibacter aquiterrae]MCC8233965.1 phosphatidylcholine/phosphatidylserine synthase [Pinisolibacter aquiterrae]
MNEQLFPDIEHQSTRTGRRFARLRSLPFRVVLPNLVTLLALCAGLTGIRMGLEGRFEWAVAAVVLAALLDAVDGRVARWLKGTSRFGAELDSLSDFVNFGVVPGLLLYIWVLKYAASFGWLAVLAYVIAAVLRLARFNVMIDKPKPAWQANFFTGMPAPAGAIAAMLPLYLAEIFEFVPARAIAGVVAVYLLVIAFMMVSTIPTWSGKKIGTRVPRDKVIPITVGVVLVIAALVSYPFPILAAVTIAYLTFIPWGWTLFRRMDRAWKDEQAAHSAHLASPVFSTDAAPRSEG